MERTIVEARRTASIGNADEIVGAGVLDIFGSDLVLAVVGANNQLIDLRFDGLDIPTDAVIVNAQIGFDATNGDDAGDGTWSFASGDFADLTGYLDISEFNSSDSPGIGRLAAIFDADATGTAIDPLPMDLVWIERPDLDRISSPSPEMARRADPGEQFDPGTIPIDQSSDPTPVVDRPAPESDAQGGDLQITTTGSDVPIVTIGEIVPLADDNAIGPLSDSSMPLINMDGFLSDGRFSGIDGSGFAAVILDTGIDLDHPFSAPTTTWTASPIVLSSSTISPTETPTPPI